MDEEIQPDPNDQIIDPAVSQDDMDTFIKSLEDGYGQNINLSTLLPQGNDTPDDDEETPEPEDQETPSDDEPTNADEFVTINGQQHRREDIQQLLEFDQFLRSNADVASRVAEAVKPVSTGQSSIPETPAAKTDEVTFQAPEPPEGLDMDDPRDKIFWDTHVDTLKSQWENRQELLKVQQSFQQQQQQHVAQQAATDMETALSRFRATFTALNDDDIATIRSEAQEIFPGLAQKMGHNADSLYRAMEVAGYANADLRKRMDGEEGKQPTQQHRSRTRKQKLNSISGSPTSAPKTEPRPVYRNDRDMVQQFADALAENGMGR